MYRRTLQLFSSALIILFGYSAFGLCVTTEKTNLRSGPGPNYKLTWSVPKYTPLLEVRRHGSWYEVQDQDGDTHWVYGQNVSKKTQCVSVLVASANLRQGPGSEYGVGDIWKVDKYTPFERLDISENGWYQVKAPWGGQYWINQGLVWRPLKVRGISY